ncbi:hypothetical protein D3C87_782800 [compost metagenome]
MKKNLLLIVVLLSSLLACKKDTTEKNTDRIVGRWIVEQVSEVSYENGIEKQRIENFAQNDDQVCEFRKDGTATVNLDGGNVDVKWTITDSKLKLSTDEATTIDFDVRTLTNNSLLLEYEEDVEVQNGTTYRRTIEFKMRK